MIVMIVVCAFYAVAWLPENVYYLIVNMGADLTFLESGYYAVLFVSFLVCLFHSPGDATRAHMYGVSRRLHHQRGTVDV